ncbi:hypothetical protein BDZ97DRAFT_1922491 [Flammula alnicola]|nr:hypothetical protein BDZ97DRAFT_1922491 [Flammula alnicola]
MPQSSNRYRQARTTTLTTESPHMSCARSQRKTPSSNPISKTASASTAHVKLCPLDTILSQLHGDAEKPQDGRGADESCRDNERYTRCCSLVHHLPPFPTHLPPVRPPQEATSTSPDWQFGTPLTSSISHKSLFHPEHQEARHHDLEHKPRGVGEDDSDGSAVCGGWDEGQLAEENGNHKPGVPNQERQTRELHGDVSLRQMLKLRDDDGRTSLLHGHAFLNLLAWAYDSDGSQNLHSTLFNTSRSSSLSSHSQITSASITFDGIKAEKDDVSD